MGGGCYFNRSENVADLDSTMCFSKSFNYLSFESAIHEIGHAIDYALSKSKPLFYSTNWKNGKFINTIVSEVEEMVNARDIEIRQLFENKDWEQLCKIGAITDYDWGYYELYGRFPQKLEYSKDLVYYSITREINNIENTHARFHLMDIVSGATDGNSCDGHTQLYWQSKTENGVRWGLGTEAFTELTHSILVNSASLKTIKIYLPKTYSVYLEMIEEATKDV